MPCPSVSIVNFELVNAGWVHASNSVVTKWQILEKKLKFWFFPVKNSFARKSLHSRIQGSQTFQIEYFIDIGYYF